MIRRPTSIVSARRRRATRAPRAVRGPAARTTVSARTPRPSSPASAMNAVVLTTTTAVPDQRDGRVRSPRGRSAPGFSRTSTCPSTAARRSVAVWSTTWSAPAAVTAAALRGTRRGDDCAPARFASCARRTCRRRRRHRRSAPLARTGANPRRTGPAMPSARPTAARRRRRAARTSARGRRTRPARRRTRRAAPFRSIGRNPITASPTAVPVTPSPIASTVPGHVVAGDVAQLDRIGRKPAASRCPPR